MPDRVMILGATSSIAQATARIFAGEGASFILVARDEKKARVVSADLVARGATKAEVIALDCASPDAPETLATAGWDNQKDPVTVVLLAYGSLTDQKRAQSDIEYLRSEIATNFTSAAALLTTIAAKMEAAHQGSIAIISSVAGERGRQSNYVYGAAKGALTVFADGLRNRLRVSGVHVVTVKPGFVDTPMTESFKKGALWASPVVVGEGIFQAIKKGRDVVYLPWFWWPIMVVIRSIPEMIFKRLSL